MTRSLYRPTPFEVGQRDAQDSLRDCLQFSAPVGVQCTFICRPIAQGEAREQGGGRNHASRVRKFRWLELRHESISRLSAAGANTSLVFGLQGLRLFVMVLAAPVLVRWLLRRSARRAG